jgi:long-chain acyl-CoA synthetase
MNCVDFFFEKTYSLEKNFTVGREEITFPVLFKKSGKLAGYIKNKYGTGKNILLLSVNNVFFITAYLSIIKSGNTCIPLDPKVEKENLDFIIGQTNPVLAFLTPDVDAKTGTGFCDKILPAELDVYIEKGVMVKNDSNFNSNETAEIIFTSGSTGVPKGVMLSHKNIIANTSSIIEYLNLSEPDRIMVVMPFFYCYGLSLLHTHLRVGGSVVLNNSFIFLGAVINDIKNNKCTGFAGVPSHFQILLRKSESFKANAFPDLRYVTQAGGKLPTVFIDEFKEAFPAIRFYVMYGQTEATARLSYLPPELYEAKKGSIGKGIPGVILKVVNEKGQEVNLGEVGEIVAKGDNVTKGYVNDPEGTAELLKDGWLHTGDLAVVDEDGFIYHSARKKEILKVGGKRVSPKEIEEVILRLHDILDCTIEPVSDELLGEAIKATVVVRNLQNTLLTKDIIKEHCAQYLSIYKIPQVIDFKDRMEVSSSGKKVKAKL